jgi:hypothetical protein
MRSGPRIGLLTLALALGQGALARADFVVTVGDATITQGGTGTLDVLIRSANPVGDPLSSFAFDLQITPTAPRHLDFRNPQLDSQLGLSNYVFVGNSSDFIGSTPVGVVQSISGGTNNRFVGGDDTNSGGNVTVTTSKLLVRLNLNAATSAPPVGGDTFNISLVPGAFTGFRDANNNLIPFTSTAGRITIVGVVPEPASLVLCATGVSLTLLAAAWRRRPRAH